MYLYKGSVEGRRLVAQACFLTLGVTKSDIPVRSHDKDWRAQLSPMEGRGSGGAIPIEFHSSHLGSFLAVLFLPSTFFVTWVVEKL